MPASRHMRPPKTTVALRVARMLADGWHIGAYPRKVTNSERGGLFPVWPVFLPPERPTARQSVCRLSAPSIVFVDIRLAGSSAASSALLSRNPRYASALRFAPEFAPSWPAGAFFPSHITAGIAGKGHASPGLHDPHGPRCLFRRFSPQSAGEDHSALDVTLRDGM